MQGKIIRIISNLYTVQVSEEQIECRARGKLRKERITPLVGDDCILDYENHYILEILPRKNFLLRPMIANVDAALIVSSVKEPNLSLYLLDKMISVISMHSIEPIICFSKIDLLTKEEQIQMKDLETYYQNLGYSVVENTDIQNLRKILNSKIVVITGQTGAGKSSLLNRLDEDLHLKTDEISHALGRGKHTTRHVELFRFSNFYIADTPGFSSLDLQEYTKEAIRNSFIEFANYPCKFKDCMHIKEKDCGVKKAVEEKNILNSRYENYLKFMGKE